MINTTVQLWLERFRGLQSLVFDSGINCHCEVTTRYVYGHDPESVSISFRMTIFDDGNDIKQTLDFTYRTWMEAVSDKEWQDFRKNVIEILFEDSRKYQNEAVCNDLHD